MSSVSIRLEKTTFQQGEPIRGTVHAMGKGRCDNLSLHLEWRTHGKGNIASGAQPPVSLFRGEWTDEGPHVYPFELLAPAGPLSYHGHYLNVDWYLRARADIPWAVDPKAEEDLVLVPGDGSVEPYFGPLYRSATAMLSEARKLRLTQLIAGIVFLVLSAGLVGIELLTDSSWILYAMAGLFGLLGISSFLQAARQTFAERKLGQVEVRLSTPAVKRGEAVGCTIRFTPRVTVTVPSVTARLSGTETVVSGSGTNRTTHSKEVAFWSVTLGRPGECRAGREVRLEGSIPVPENAPFTFAATDNELKWTIAVHVEADRAFDWKHDFPITVRP